MASIVLGAVFLSIWDCFDGIVDLFIEMRRVFIVLLLRLRLVGLVSVSVGINVRFSFGDRVGIRLPNVE